MEFDRFLDAGDFTTWKREMKSAIRGEGESDVACGTCTACCTSSQFVHIAPTETDALAHIPNALLFPAPNMAKGHVLLGYDEQGHCPMLVNNKCSIYEHRPRTCRVYDCRIFAAAAVVVEEPDKHLIATQAVRWQFNYANESARVEHDATRAAAHFIRAHRNELTRNPTTSTQLAVLAFDIHRLFYKTNDTGLTSPEEPSVDAVNQVLAALAAARPMARSASVS
jgi:uncharacterized protein